MSFFYLGMKFDLTFSDVDVVITGFMIHESFTAVRFTSSQSVTGPLETCWLVVVVIVGTLNINHTSFYFILGQQRVVGEGLLTGDELVIYGRHKYSRVSLFKRTGTIQLLNLRQNTSKSRHIMSYYGRFTVNTDRFPVL